MEFRGPLWEQKTQLSLAGVWGRHRLWVRRQTRGNAGAARGMQCCFALALTWLAYFAIEVGLWVVIPDLYLISSH